MVCYSMLCYAEMSNKVHQNRVLNIISKRMQFRRYLIESGFIVRVLWYHTSSIL